MSDDKRVSEPSTKYLAVRQENDEYDAAVPLENCEFPEHGVDGVECPTCKGEKPTD